jgi:hypothetical protein
MREQNSSKSSHGTVGDKFNRRKFLAAAGASALALPLIGRHPVLAAGQTMASCSGCGDVNLIPSPNPWLIRGCNTDTVCDYNAVGITVTGVRHYCGTNEQPASFPCRPDFASLCLTIYPNVSNLLTGIWDGTLAMLLQNATPRDMMSCWHELAGGKSDASGHLITHQDAANMQNYILNFRANNYPNSSMAFGAIECGNGNPNGGWAYVQPFMAPGLDFYGNDLYRGNYSDPVSALDAWEAGAVTSGYSPNATIAVTECNCHDESFRPCFFYHTANWVWNQKNRGARSFLCFWGGSGSLGGPWDPSDTATINELINIGNGNYSNPGGC